MKSILILPALLLLSILSSPLHAQTDYQYLIRVSLDQRKLFLHPVDNETQVLNSYTVAVPKKKCYPLPMQGVVESIDIDPYWYPLEESRSLYLKDHGEELPAAIPPGDPRNAMGKAKFNVRWETTDVPFKVHGTNQPASIGKNVTGGCIRLSNENVLKLAQMLAGTKIKVRFEN